jgi:hypothetical protein
MFAPQGELYASCKGKSRQTPASESSPQNTSTQSEIASLLFDPDQIPLAQNDARGTQRECFVT